jgi:hypothetical protein
MAETVVPAPTGGPVSSPGPPVTGGAKPPAPALSAVKLGSNRFAARKGTTLKLRVTVAARIRVLITQTVTGHKLKGVCKPQARAGRRCTATITKHSLTFTARAGASRFKLKLPGLAKGAYTATITAQNANGKSRPIKLRFTITHKSSPA